ncbi:site-specific integrase [Paenibacillus sp. Leaf72]|uniref:site-specific integrase n=1 Tax=Paenibacillus sp. Leaf72 TaxID=1736234 RepID=UPI00070201BA|nr:site-specific integrase [Paenibacillus sp. Leaf72]KQO18057.1 hypothetical protein ASF12_05275 [Paenibacillus sp. Leaf72]
MFNQYDEWNVDSFPNPEYKSDESRYSHKFVVVEVLAKREHQKTTYLIYLKCLVTGRRTYHPITAYLFGLEKGRLSSGTLRQYAYVVTSFLNHIWIDYADNYQINDLTDLKFEHMTSFLNFQLFVGKKIRTDQDREFQAKPNVVETVDKKRARLSDFLYYLAIIFPMKHIFINHFTVTLNSYGVRSVFSEHINQNRSAKVLSNRNQGSRQKILHGLPFDLIPIFLLDSIIRRPEMALPIYFGIFGGIRIGEICNIRHQDLIKTINGPNGEDGFTVDIKNQRIMFGPNGSTGHHGKVKIKRRDQRVYNINNMLVVLYKRHIKLLETFYPNRQIDYSHALFLNSYGKPYTSAAMSKAFNTIKNQFLKRLSIGTRDEIQLASNLEKCKWAFHITRGMFSNIIAKSGSSALDLMYARGDSSLLSSLPYLEGTSITTEQIEETLSKIDEKFKEFGVVI